MATKNHNTITHTYYYLRMNRWKWARFKAVCAKKGRPMRQVISDFVDAYTEANE